MFCCLMSSEKYIMHIQDGNKLKNMQGIFRKEEIMNNGEKDF